MKKQTGIWIDSEVWRVYRDLCSREKLRPAEPIEGFLRLVLRNGSASAVLSMMQGVEKAKSEGFEAYVRVLINWYRNGREWIYVTDEAEAPVKTMLLNALKDVSDPQLRREVEEALMIKATQKASGKSETDEADEAEKTVDNESEVKSKDEEVEDSEEPTKKVLSVDELQKKMDELKRLMEPVKDAKTS